MSTVITPELFKAALANFPSGVTVITANPEGADAPYGMTASAFLSVSLDPPLILESVAKTARMHETLAGVSRFGVSILNRHQANESNFFAGFGKEGFTPNFDMLDGFPMIAGAITQLVCHVHERVDAGDHTLYIGRIEHAQVTEGEPLLYFKRQYGHVSVVP